MDTFAPRQKLSAEAQAWARYRPGVSMPDGRGMGRLLWELTQIESLLSADPKTLVANKIRTPLFFMEGTLRAYSADFPQLKAQLDAVKTLEDAIGAADAPQSPTAQAAAEQALTALVQSQWTPGPDGKVPALDAVLAAAEAVPLGDDAADADRMKRAIIGVINGIRHKTFDFTTLQGNDGIHELRRQVRWVEQYNDLAKMNGASLHLVPSALVTDFTNANGDLSDVKDRGEAAEEKAKELVDASGGTLSETDARAQATTALGPDYAPDALTAAAQGVFDKLLAQCTKYQSILGP